MPRYGSVEQRAKAGAAWCAGGRPTAIPASSLAPPPPASDFCFPLRHSAHIIRLVHLPDEPRDDPIPTRATLIQRLKDWQDQASWQDFFDTYSSLLFRFALKCGLNETEATDAVQDTIIAVARRMPHFHYDPARGSFKSWLLNLAYWRIADHLRQRADPSRPRPFSNQTFAGDDTIARVADPNALAAWDTEWQRHLLDAALARVKRRVDPQTYQMFDLYEHKNWPAQRVAETFDVPVGQVYLAKHRVLDKLKEEIARLEAGPA